MPFIRLIQIPLLTAALLGAPKPTPLPVYPRWEFHVHSSSGFDQVCFSQDGKGVVWFTSGHLGLVQCQRWRLPSGQAMLSISFPVEPTSEHTRGGDAGYAQVWPIHEHSRALTWISPTAPLFDWGSGQVFDFEAGTRKAIPGHSDRDEWEFLGVEQGWLLSGLRVKRMGDGEDAWFTYSPEWSATSVSPTKVIPIMDKIRWLGGAVEAIAPDGSWIAAASITEPTLPKPDRGAWKFHDERVLRIWRAGSAMPTHRIPLASMVRRLSFSPHGHYLVVDYVNGDRELWDTGSGHLIGALPDRINATWSEDESSILFMDPRSELHPMRIPSLEAGAPYILRGVGDLRSYGPVFSADLRFAAYWNRQPIEGKEGTPEADEVRILVFDLAAGPGPKRKGR